MKGSLHLIGQVVTPHPTKDRCMELIYKAISHINPKTNKYCKRENNISKDAKLKLEVFASIAKLPTNVE